MKKALFVGFVLVVSYCGVIQAIWSFNNPKANRTTVLTHFWDAVKFKSLPEFQ